jgi:phosphoadenosine phosphosulfate reductase
MIRTERKTLFGEDVLDLKIKTTQDVVREAATKSKNIPLIINFSGGKDSLSLLQLVREVTDNFRCFYMVSGIEFPEAITFAQSTCDKFGVELLLSYPKDYKGDFFQRLEQFRRFPALRTQWCNRDLKIRPQTKVLERIFGRQPFFKLNGVRRTESARRMRLYNSKQFFKPEYQVTKKHTLVFPIFLWTDEDVKEYLQRKQMIVPKNPLYDIYGVSGCYWCPFYQSSIYKRILHINLNLYDRFIDWECKLNCPSVNGYIWLRDLKEEVVSENEK